MHIKYLFSPEMTFPGEFNVDGLHQIGMTAHIYDDLSRASTRRKKSLDGVFRKTGFDDFVRYKGRDPFRTRA